MKSKSFIAIALVAFLLAGCSSSVSLPSGVTITLTRYDIDSKSITISWTANADKEFTQYSIYRGTSTGLDNSGTPLTTITDQTTSSYTDTFDSKPTEYYYYVVYVENSAGAAASNEEMITGLYLFNFTFGECGSGDGQFDGPADVAVDSSGNIFVGDRNNDRIQKFDSSGNFLSKWGTTGAGDGQFTDPYNVEYAPDGKLYVGDYNNNRVQIFDTSGNFIEKFSTTGSPGDVYVDSSTNVYVPDYDNAMIRIFNSSYTETSTFGSFGSGDGQFNHVWDVAGSPDGTKIYALDAANISVQIFTADGTYSSQFITSGTDEGECDDCWGLAVDNYGYVYVTDMAEGKVQIYTAEGDFDQEFTTPAGATTYGTWGLDFDGNNNLYVIDSNNCTIHMYGP